MGASAITRVTCRYGVSIDRSRGEGPLTISYDGVSYHSMDARPTHLVVLLLREAGHDNGANGGEVAPLDPDRDGWDVSTARM
jgi:hypothetical protein